MSAFSKSRLYTLTFLLVGAVAALLLLEILFRQLPVNTGLRMIPVDSVNPIMRARPHQSYVFSVGWALANVRRGTTNNYGFVNPLDYEPNAHPIAVLGNSFIESMMNDPDETLQGRLRHHLGNKEAVYSVAASGAHLSDYLVLAKYAKVEFAPRALIILVTDSDVALSILGPGMTPSPGNTYFVTNADGSLALNTTEYRPSRNKELLRHSALMRYLYINLKLNLSISSFLAGAGQPGQQGEIKTDAQPSNNVEIEKLAVNKFLDDLPFDAGLSARHIILIMDEYRVPIYMGHWRPSNASPDIIKPYFIERARAKGYEVVDMGPIFAQNFATNGVRFDYLPLDGHWNPLAHSLAEQAVYPLIMKILGNNDGNQ